MCSLHGQLCHSPRCAGSAQTNSHGQSRTTTTPAGLFGLLLCCSTASLSRAEHLPWLWRELLSEITGLPGAAETLQRLCTPVLPCPQENELYPTTGRPVPVSQWETPEKFTLFYARISGHGMACTHHQGHSESPLCGSQQWHSPHIFFLLPPFFFVYFPGIV